MSAPCTQPPSFPGASLPGLWRLTLLLTAVIFGLLLFANRTYLFATRLHENTDVASDSLMVREAKHSFLLHGHYSQWRFYHPGPALLDTLAAGEALFFDRLHLVPTPYNGQLIALCLVTVFFFSLALGIFARELGRSRGGGLFFLPLALSFAVWHYGAVGGQVFLDAWPAYPPVLTFLCFLVAAAAAAAGGGWALPVVAVTGSWLVHNHVAQPLFVVPLTALAYAGLLAACRRRPGRVAGGRQRGAAALTAGWRVFPRAHAVAAVLLAIFILPLLLDAAHGRDSNFARILAYLRSHHEPSKNLARSFCYFLTFGGYGPYQANTRAFGHYDASGLLAFAASHWTAYTGWLLALVGTPALFFTLGRRARLSPPSLDDPRRNDFLPWFFGILAAAWALTLVWGTRQDGPMYYYNAYFNYSIYFGLALGLAAALAASLMAWSDPPRRRRWRPAFCALLWVGAAGAAVLRADRFRVDAYGTPEDEAMARTVARAAAALPENAVCFLDCRPWENWTATIAVALEMERLGRKVGVNDNWEIIFGDPLTIRHEPVDAATPLARWMVKSLGEAPPHFAERPLLFGCELDLPAPPILDPAGGRIRFAHDGNYDEFAVFGWSPTGGDWTWSDQNTALLMFRPLPLPKEAVGAEVLVAAWTLPPPGKSDLQTVEIDFNDHLLGTDHLPLGPSPPPLRFRIRAEWWQEAVVKGEARLRFRFPDAKSPASLGLSDDTRCLGGGFRSIEFQPVLPE